MVPPEAAGGIGAVPEIETAQDSVHPRLASVVHKHLKYKYQRQPTQSMQKLFAEIYERYHQSSIILDTGCGRGHSTRFLARQYPQHMVLGLDKSAHRLQHLSQDDLPDNARLLRVELVDFWLLAQAHQWRFDRVYVLYPNPWPKTKHLQRRWHAHGVFPAILETADSLVLRTNWKLYAEEFALAASLAQRKPTAVTPLEIPRAGPFMSAFERKYVLAGQPVYAVQVS